MEEKDQPNAQQARGEPWIMKTVIWFGSVFALVALLLIYASTADTSQPSHLSGLAGIFADGRTAKAEDALREYVKARSQGHIVLGGFEKTGGQESEADGVKYYEVDYRATISFPSEGYWVSRNPTGGPGLSFDFADAASVGSYGMLSGAVQVRAGTSVAIVGAMNGQKGDSGWGFYPGERELAQGGR